MYVKRPDAEELVAIRNGALTYDQVIESAENLMKECDELYKTTTLRKEPDRNAINRLVINMIDRYVSKNG